MVNEDPTPEEPTESGGTICDGRLNLDERIYLFGAMFGGWFET